MPDASLAPLLIQGIVTLAGGGTMAGVIGAVVSHRKTKAETAKTAAETGKTEAEVTSVAAGAAQTQVDTSLKLMQWMESQLEVMRADMATARQTATEARAEAVSARQEIEKLRAWRTRQEILNAAHGEWDGLVTARLSEAGINVPPPPPLHAD